MKLKSLDIKGFKSFANATSISFNEGVTGIVGPNGSGKSNIVDSIRWVLGEQKSKELRLESMGDVIFNGTKSKKKSGAAQVTLTFENTKNILPTEYKEVAISRTLYRSGESEYRLNGVKCRLKDIRDLFLDSGIGSNTYAIIELGMVESILSDKENARRKMFEQAAGISKFKIRKREALSKLKATKADLDRVEDLLFELEGNMKSLEKQAKRTEKFYTIKEEYKQLKMDVAGMQIQDIDTKIADFNQKLESLTKELSVVKGNIFQQEAKLENLKTKTLKDEKLLAEQQKELNDLSQEISSLESKESLRKQELVYLQNDDKRIHAELQSLKMQKSDIIEKIGRRQQSLEEAQTLLKTKESEHTSLKQAYEAFKLKVDGEAESASVQQQQLNAIVQQIYAIEKDIATQEVSIDNNKRQQERLRQQEQSVAEEMTQLSETVSGLRDQSAESSTALVTKQTALTKAQEEHAKLVDIIDEQRRDIANQQRKLDKVTNESSLLKNMVESLDGFPESVKFLHTHTKGKLQLLSDLFFCPEEYRTVVESYLDSYLNYFVVDSEEEAKSAIQVLKDGQRGRASFFVLDRMPTLTLNADKNSIISKLKFDEKYAALFAYLFKDALIQDKTAQADSEYITPDATLINKRYTISGGSVGLFSGKKVGRKKAYEAALKDVESLEKQLAAALPKLKDNEQRLKNIDLKSMQKEVNALQLEVNNANFKLKQYEERLASLQQNNTDNSTRVGELGQAIANAEQSVVALKAKRQEAEAQKTALEQTIHQEQLKVSNLQSELGQKSAATNQAHIEYIKQDNLCKGLVRDLEQATAEQTSLTTRIAKSEEEQATITTKLIELTKSATGNDDTLKSHYEQKATMVNAVSEIEQAYFAQKSTIQEEEKTLRELQAKLMEYQSEIGKTKETLHTYSYERKSLYQKLTIEFNIKESDIVLPEEMLDDDTKGMLLLKLEKVEKRIANYGDINPMAITAFNEIKERHTYIIAQRDDILDANHDLEQTIKEIEVEANAMFLDAFHKVKNYFQEVFRTFFTEDDQCDLILVDEDNPLDSAIEILAKPKGKRPKSLSQLSGGEKTLTATALLFALYLIKPAPFCIFDEVDAPLDDVNVQKFTKLIRQFSQNSQFVIITHNKVTMAAVDTLYGVFMQDMGVSEISHVDFSDKSFDFNYEGFAK